VFNAIHVTHEAVQKVGGIGTVLEGLINSRPYRDEVARTVLVCPMFHPERPARLGPDGIVEYSSLDHHYGGPHARAFEQVEREFGVRIAYGRRVVRDIPSARQTTCEVLLIDLRGINRERVNALKGRLWDRFGLHSDRYEHNWEYDQYVQVAAPAVAALDALGLGTPELPAVVFGHEFMGVPTALALQAERPACYRSVFYAHEVGPIRRLVEQHPGHDIAVYNALHLGLRSGLDLEQVFGPQGSDHRFAIVRAARHCDGVIAVGNHVADELRFLGPEFDHVDITLAYNGVPAIETTLAERAASRSMLRAYAENLFGWQPDLIFTHVTRLTPSKALWRDLDVLAALEPHLAAAGRTAVLLLLATELPCRAGADVHRMERDWSWPLAHREGAPDLTGGEAALHLAVQAFNARARQARVVLINQFGFDRASCGMRVPSDADFIDLRRGSDVELGLSAYEPFGIAPLEPLTYGGLCVVSTSSGCVGFVKQAAGRRRLVNVVTANYVDAYRRPRSVRDALEIDADARRAVERKVAAQVAEQIAERLPMTDAAAEALLEAGDELARRMSWDVVAERSVLPAVRRASARRRALSVA
jgi:hypothetical protein